MNETVILVLIFVGSIMTIIGLLMMFSRQDASSIRRLHIADLEYMLIQLNAEKSELEAEIKSVSQQLETDRYAENAFKKRQHEHIDTRSDLLIDRQFPDVSPRAY